MGIFLHGGLDTQRQSRSGTRRDQSAGLDGGWNLILSSGDRTRALLELQYLDGSGGNDPIHFQFESKPDLARFFREADSLSRIKPIRVVHAYDLYAAATALSVRETYRYKVVLDYVPIATSIPPDEEAAERPLWGSRALGILQEWVLRKADHVVVETRASGRYLRNQYSIPAEKLSVIPNCVDANIFRWDAELREQNRSELGLADRLVVAHVEDIRGASDAAQIVEVFRNLRERYPSAHLLSLSAKPGEVQHFLKIHLPPDSYSAWNPATEHLPVYLSAADLGLLFPQRRSQTGTLSPTEFAQYLNCGVPVIITPGVGDYSNLVRHKLLGEVLKNSMISERLIRTAMHSRNEIVHGCVREGRDLTWQHLQHTAKHVF